ncbi:N-acetylmuramoyl-L-alanine amidase [Sulfitobacter alexandrii]|uniref:N-acetylmuramoyl-L-alanine amidase n=1 Tax=Sulfitobacter alexandrii TaxID=1917485 RepID=A0A1J0WEW2_9RHOB|nr:N-acetylmuramoyl-L-alanine amidase [Sulfitobacter alexandrii]APE42849.1 N-acetylmuramoyl-L-alanine amidase [Sulfitobacter alexandrii]
MAVASSPNFGPRRDGLTPRLIVIHYTAMQSAEAALARLCDPQAEVSAHYLIAADGRCLQLVAEEMRAWHAGAGEWAGQQDINSRSIGIELDNRGDHPFSEPQMQVLEKLLRDLMDRWGIPAAGVLGHSDIAPGRKQDPGPRFDWQRLALRGLAVPTPAPRETRVSEAAFRAAARAAGYTADVPFDTLLAATRLRHGPWRHGPLCDADLALPPV